MIGLGSCFIFIFALTKLTESAVPNNCTIYCDNIFKPICAQSDSNTFRFVNECFMGYENCRSGSNFKKVNDDNEACTKFENTGCAFKCSSKPEEVCAFNEDEYKEFVNTCQMISINCNTDKSEFDFII